MSLQVAYKSPLCEVAKQLISLWIILRLGLCSIIYSENVTLLDKTAFKTAWTHSGKYLFIVNLECRHSKTIVEN